MSNKSFTELPSAEIIRKEWFPYDKYEDDSHTIAECGGGISGALRMRSEAEKALAYEQWKAGVFAEWIDSIHPLTPHDVNTWRHMKGVKKSHITTQLYNCEEFKEYLEKRRKEEGK